MESSSSKNKGKYLNLNFEKEFPSIPGKPLFDFHCVFKMPSGLSLSGVLFVTRSHLCFASYSTPIFKYHHKQIIEMEKLSIIHHTVSSIIIVSRTHKKQVYEMTDLDDLQFILSKITKLWLQVASKEPSPPHSAHSNNLRAPLPTTPLSRSRSDSSLKKRNVSKLKRGKIAITDNRAQRTYSDSNGHANLIDQVKWGSQSDRTHSVPPSDGEEEKDPDIESYVSSGSLDKIAQEANGSETEEERPQSVVRVMRHDFVFDESQYLDTLRLKEIRDVYSSHFYGRHHYNFLGLDGDRKCVCVVSVLPEGITSDLPPGVAPGALRAILTDKNAMDEFCISESSLKKKDSASCIELFLNRHCVENISFYSLPNEFSDDFAKFTQQHFKPVKTLKVGVLYAKPDQTLQQIFQNSPPPDNPFWKFMDTIASKIELNGWKKYSGDFGLVDQQSYYTEWKGIELMFHVAPLLNKEQHRQLIGNDIVFIVYYDDSDSDQTFNPAPLSSLGIIPQIFCIVQAEEGPSYKLQFLQRTNIKMFDPVAPPRNHMFKTSEISDYLFTKLHNGYVMSTQCPPMNHLVSTPRKAFLEDFGEKYSKERLRRLRSKSKSTSRTKINQEIKHNSLRDEHISMRAKFSSLGNDKNKISPRCNEFETNPIPTPNKPTVDFSDQVTEVKSTPPLQETTDQRINEDNVKVLQSAPALGRLQHFQTMLYNEYQNLPPLSSSQPVIMEKYNPSKQPPSPIKEQQSIPISQISPRNNEATEKENCKPTEAGLSSGSSTKEVQVWFKTFMGGKFSDISQYFVEDDGFDLLGYSEDQFSRILPDQRTSLRLFNALKIYK